MNATLKSSGTQGISNPAKGDSDEIVMDPLNGAGITLPTQSSAIGVVTYSGLVTGNPNLDAKLILLSLLARYD